MTESDVVHPGAGDGRNTAGTHAEVEGTVRPIAAYALGLNVRDYRGRTLLQHTGGLPGDVSKLAMILVPSSPAVDFSFDFQDLVLRPVSPDSGAQH